MIALLATAFVQTSTYAPERCDTIEMVRGDPFYEIHYVNSAEQCSQGGTWVVELDGIRVEVSVIIARNEEIVRVNVLDDLPMTVEPGEMDSVPDNGEAVVFTLIPMMF